MEVVIEQVSPLIMGPVIKIPGMLIVPNLAPVLASCIEYTAGATGFTMYCLLFVMFESFHVLFHLVVSL